MTYALSKFRLSDVLRCGAALRSQADDAQSMQQVADRIVRHLYERITIDSAPQRAFTLVRLFKTHPAGLLSSDLRAFVETRTAEPITPYTPCLTLLATAGDEPEWNSPQSSNGHRAIPLTSEAMIGRAPMIARLFHDFGVPLQAVIEPGSDVLIDVQHTAFSVFHIEQAKGSPWIPSQKDFVEPYGIRSVLGFGGVLATGGLFAVLLFSRFPIAAPVAQLFGSLALNVKVAIQPFGDDQVFAG